MENDFLTKQTKIVEDMDIDEFNDIDKFGKNLLYKMGWKDNTAIGRNPKNGLTKPVELIPRQKGLGLGAIRLPTGDSDNKNLKGKKRDTKNFTGTKVKIIEGTHKGLKGIISDQIIDESLKEYLKRNDFINIQLDINNQGVKVKTSSIEIRDNKEGKKLKISRSRSRSISRSRSKSIDEYKSKKKTKKKSRSRSRKKCNSRSRSKYKEEKNNKENFPYNDGKDNNNQSNKSRRSRSKSNKINPGENDKVKESSSNSEKNLKQESSGTRKELKWIQPNIQIRIISTTRLGGKFYNTKAKILEILDKYTFILLTNNGTLSQEFKEKDLETVIPDIGNDVLILKGDNRGETAKLLERDKKKNKVLLQLHHDLSIVEMTQDDCSLYNNQHN